MQTELLDQWMSSSNPALVICSSFNLTTFKKGMHNLMCHDINSIVTSGSEFHFLRGRGHFNFAKALNSTKICRTPLMGHRGQYRGQRRHGRHGLRDFLVIPGLSHEQKQFMECSTWLSLLVSGSK